MRISIFGHTGKMGMMLSERLQKAGHTISGVDLPFDIKDIEQSLKEAHILILCIPAKAMEEITKKAAPFFHDSLILMDVTSVKILPMRSMEKYHLGPVVGTHPLFGPRSLEYNKICICKGAWFDNKQIPLQIKEDVLKRAEQVFHDINCETFLSSPEEHDKAMAALQGLNFVTNVAYFAMTANMDNLAPFLTPSFIRRLEASRTLMNDDGDLFMGIFKANPMSQDIVRQYRLFLNVAAGGDMDVLVELAKKWFKNA